MILASTLIDVLLLSPTGTLLSAVAAALVSFALLSWLIRSTAAVTSARVLGGGFGLGATVVLSSAFAVEDLVPNMTGVSAIDEAIGSVLVAPPVEEAFKLLAVVCVAFLVGRRLGYVRQMAAVAAATGLGFAMTENILYYAAAFHQGADRFAVLVIARGLGTCWVHPLATAVGTVVACRVRSPMAAVAGLLSAAAIHASFNGASLGGVLVGLPVFVGAIGAYFGMSWMVGRPLMPIAAAPLRQYETSR